MDRFNIWLEDQTQAQVEQLVASMRGFHPTSTKPYPGFGQSEPNMNAYDVAAVVAGTKPAASMTATFFRSPIGAELVRRAVAMGMTYAQGFGITGQGKGSLVIGRPQNVAAIVKAFKTINLLMSNPSQNAHELIRAHETIGVNLGYPPDAIKKFSQMMLAQYQKGKT